MLGKLQKLRKQLLWCLLGSVGAYADSKPACQAGTASWAVATLKQMTVREKIGQLCIVAVSSDCKENELLASPAAALQFPVMHPAHVEQLVKQYHVGGIIFLCKQRLQDQVAVTNRLQAASKIPLLVVEDLEWGLAMRIHDTIAFPRNFTLGAIHNEQLVYELGKEIGRQCKAIGVHMNIAPVVDINTNPANPVINDRSFGCDKEKVARLGVLFMQGLHDAGILACAKHFPGHGDTATDSHVAVPVVHHDQRRLFDQELYPFAKMIDAGVDAVMTAHVQVPAFDGTTVATLSRPIVTDLLQKKLGFTGLVMTDALNMGALKQYPTGERELRALVAGNDLLVVPLHVPQVIEHLEQAVRDGKISEKMLDERVLKLLQTKASVGLPEQRFVANKHVHKIVTTPAAQRLKKRLYAEAMTLVSNKGDIIPLHPSIQIPTEFTQDERLCDPLPTSLKLRRASCGDVSTCSTKPWRSRNHAGWIVQIGGQADDLFVKTMTAEHDAPVTYLSATMSAAEGKQHAHRYKKNETVVVAIHNMQKLVQKNWGISAGTKTFVAELMRQKVPVVLVLFGSPYSVKLFPEADALLVAYEDVPEAQYAAAHVLLGNKKATGTLPICARSV